MKQKVTSVDQLPRFSYTIPGSLIELLTSEEAFRPFADRVRIDAESVLAQYDIDDKAELSQWHGVLMAIALLEGRDAEAREKIGILRELEEKPAGKYMTGLFAESLIDARQHAAHTDGPEPSAALREAVRRHFAEKVTQLPWEIVRDDVKALKGNTEILSADLYLGMVESQFEPAVKKLGAVSGDIAMTLITIRGALVRLPYKQEIVEVLSDYIASHSAVKEDIWAARSVTLSAADAASPVLVGIWDSGVDTGLFPTHLPADGPEGIAFDRDGNPSPTLLYPLTPEQAEKYPDMQKLLRGFTDLQASLDTPEASHVKKTISSLQRDQVKPFIEELTLVGQYTHGTHVAGIALQGNPFAQLVVGRITFDHRMIPDPPTDETEPPRAESLRKTVEYFQRYKARVVNMSWGMMLKGFEQRLEINGIGETTEERRTIARRYFDMHKSALSEAMAAATDVLFVAAAGNSDNDASFNEFIPSSLQLPNLLTVGAVDKAGEETGFTSYGETVTVHANGFEVESLIPGGAVLPLSGTSMAAPNVTNLAAKLIAIEPALPPAEVIDLIRQSADRAEDGRRRLINPTRAVELLRERISVDGSSPA